MCPSFREGDIVLASGLLYRIVTPKKGDVVVVSHPKKHVPLLKRITKIQKDRYFLEGDNKDESTDSHSFGWLEREKIMGKVVYVL